MKWVLKKTLFFHTDVHWLLQSRVLSRLYELNYEMFVLDNTKFCEMLPDGFCVQIWLIWYIWNSNILGKKENTLTFTDKLFDFKKIQFWVNEMRNRNVIMLRKTIASSKSMNSDRLDLIKKKNWQRFSGFEQWVNTIVFITFP